MTAIVKCICKNEGQDKLHGAGLRAHNSCMMDTKTPGWRCTVCLREKAK